jgi:hypothetical protein
MPDIHILDVVGNTLRVVCHIPVTVANNAAGVAWSVALVNSGNAKASILPVGTGPGQITAPEAAQLAAGTLLEVVMVQPVEINPTPQRGAQEVREIWAQAAQQALVLQQTLNWFGTTMTRA